MKCINFFLKKLFIHPIPDREPIPVFYMTGSSEHCIGSIMESWNLKCSQMESTLAIALYNKYHTKLHLQKPLTTAIQSFFGTFSFCLPKFEIQTEIPRRCQHYQAGILQHWRLWKRVCVPFWNLTPGQEEQHLLVKRRHHLKHSAHRSQTSVQTVERRARTQVWVCLACAGGVVQVHMCQFGAV